MGAIMIVIAPILLPTTGVRQVINAKYMIKISK